MMKSCTLTDIVFYVMNGESWRWNMKIEPVGPVDDDWNIKAILLQIFTRQVVSTQL